MPIVGSAVAGAAFGWNGAQRVWVSYVFPTDSELAHGVRGDLGADSLSVAMMASTICVDISCEFVEWEQLGVDVSATELVVEAESAKHRLVVHGTNPVPGPELNYGRTCQIASSAGYRRSQSVELFGLAETGSSLSIYGNVTVSLDGVNLDLFGIRPCVESWQGMVGGVVLSDSSG